MRVPKKGMNKIKGNKNVSISKRKPHVIRKEQVLVVAQEIKYARLLSGNEKKTRDRVLKALKKWLTNCFEKGYEFKEDDFMRVWKGLFYAVWMSDKPLIQEELCDSIAGILDLFPPEQLKHALLMAKAGFKMLATEWFGIDHHRMDKFLMLVRRYLRGSLRCLARCQWALASCQQYADMLTANDGVLAASTPRYARNATSMLMHIVDCFLEELAKVSAGAIPEESVAALLAPFITYTCVGAVPALCVASRRLLTALLRQSEPGLRYQERTRAWHKLGCPGSGPDALELASDDEEHTEGSEHADEDEPLDDDDGSRPLDPRAGRVDVLLPLLPVPAASLAGMLRDLRGRTSSKAHKRISICLQRFESLAAGEYPLVVHNGAADQPVAVQPQSSLRALEARLKEDTDELKLRGLSRKHRKRLLRKSRLGQSIVDDVPQERNTRKNKRKNGEWLIESTTTKSDKDSSNKENLNKKNIKKPKEKTLKRKLETQNGDGDLPQHADANKKQKNDSKDKTKLPKKDEVQDNSLKKVKTKEDIKRDLKTTKTETRQKKIKEKDINRSQTNITRTESSKPDKLNKVDAQKKSKNKTEPPKLLINKLKNYSKQVQKDKKSLDTKFEKDMQNVFDSPKKVKFVLKNNSMQKPVDYYLSVRQSPDIPFDGGRKPNKTNLKPSIPSPINPFFKRKLRIK